MIKRVEMGLKYLRLAQLLKRGRIKSIMINKKPKSIKKVQRASSLLFALAIATTSANNIQALSKLQRSKKMNVRYIIHSSSRKSQIANLRVHNLSFR